MLLDALRGINRKRPPVWLMRQAGRYLPEYAALRAKHSLKQLFFTPELAAAVTKMPVDRFGVDAAILFSDITVVAEALGLKLEFQEGPVVEPWESFSHTPEKLDPIIDTVKILKEDLKVPLIGFCGGPFTVATYLLGGIEEALKHPQLNSFLDKIADVSCDYLQRQVAAGVDAVQIFDSWANVLTKEQFRLFCLPYLQRFIEAAKVPAIFFMRGAASHIDDIDCGISIDWETDMLDARKRTNMPLQGNINPDLLFGPLEDVRAKTKELLKKMRGDPGFIVNLGHGIKPKTPVEAVKCLIDTVKEIE